MEDASFELKTYTKDFVLNILATFLTVGVMQLVILPQLSRSLTPSDYGVMLTATGFMNVLTNAFGNNLCNSRLRQQAKYDNKKVVGDYQIILIAILIISVILILIFSLSLKLEDSNVGLVCPFAIITVTGIAKAYYLVTYRLTINYKRNLIANFCGCIGYAIGGFVLIKYINWPWVFLPADILTLIYIMFSSDIMKEPIQKTELFNDSVNVTSTLFTSGLIGNITIYLDRFIIYPTLGSESVSNYSTAAWFSKSILIVMAPITSVLLSYITVGKLKLNKRKFNTVCVILLIGLAVCWLGAIVFAPIITGWMYPTLIDGAKPYISSASLSVVIGILGNFLSVVVFAYAPIKWQAVIPAIKILIYILLGVLLVKTKGIMGMIVSVFVANLLCNIILFFVARRWVREDLL